MHGTHEDEVEELAEELVEDDELEVSFAVNSMSRKDAQPRIHAPREKLRRIRWSQQTNVLGEQKQTRWKTAAPESEFEPGSETAARLLHRQVET